MKTKTLADEMAELALAAQRDRNSEGWRFIMGRIKDAAEKGQMEYTFTQDYRPYTPALKEDGFVVSDRGMCFVVAWGKTCQE